MAHKLTNSDFLASQHDILSNSQLADKNTIAVKLTVHMNLDGERICLDIEK
uniref:Uncharacterized protein n=1 Tax=Yersinia enterocolitica W22703 TaxID=913028 RepID=F4MU03_YEREN|nr:unknown protein [Yersinia enterocolitica W22703]